MYFLDAFSFIPLLQQDIALNTIIFYIEYLLTSSEWWIFKKVKNTTKLCQIIFI